MKQLFLIGKYYRFKAPQEIMENPYENLWFNEEMVAWFDGKKRKCTKSKGTYDVSFEGIKGCWDYSKAVSYMMPVGNLNLKQEEMDI